MTTNTQPKPKAPTLRRRGQLVQMGQEFVVFLLIITVLTGVAATVLNAYQQTTLDGGDTVDNETNVAFATVGAGLNGTLNFAQQTPTIGTLGGVALLLAVIGIGLLAVLGKGFGGKGGGSGGGFG